MGLTFLTAVAVGYRPDGPLLELLLVCVLCSAVDHSDKSDDGGRPADDVRSADHRLLSVLHPDVLLRRDVSSSASEALYPRGRAFNVNDVLPTTHAIDAMGKVLNYGTEPGLVSGSSWRCLHWAHWSLTSPRGFWLFRRRYLRTG